MELEGEQGPVGTVQRREEGQLLVDSAEKRWDHSDTPKGYFAAGWEWSRVQWD